MPEYPFVSVIVPVYRSRESLIMCLRALSAQTYPQQRFEIIVVNNDPNDKPQVFEQLNLPNLRLINESRPGSYAARNSGISVAQGHVMAFCDADCIPAPDWIEQGIQHLQSNPEVSRLAGRVELISSGKQPNYAELYESIFSFRQEEYARNGASATANMFAYRQVFTEVGLFREDLLSGGDLEWGRRAQAAGWDIQYSPHAVVRHPARNTVDKLARKAKRVCSGYIELNQAQFDKRPWTALYHGLSMFKPPIKAGRMIFSRHDIPLKKKMVLYGLDYRLKLIQLMEYIRLQAGNKASR